ncbi:MAG: asparaginase [Burkholderiaceae bacterium]
MKIVVLGTGGTIAGLAANPADSSQYTAGQLGVAELLSDLPSIGQHQVLAEQVAQIDSKDMTHEIWLLLAKRCAHWLAQDDVQALVITHGTDTLEETAFFLQTLLAPRKAVVLTCAMRPANALDADGPQNLRDALVVAAHPLACGVVAVCAGEVHSARDVQKVHAWRLDAFSSGEAGPLAVVEEGIVRPLQPFAEWPAQLVRASASLSAIADLLHWPPFCAWPRVEIVWSHAAAHPGVVDALLSQDVQGIVVAGTGNGRVHQALLPALRQAKAVGIRVVLATRCANPQVRLPAGASLEFADAGGLPPVKARIALLLQLWAADV